MLEYRYKLAMMGTINCINASRQLQMENNRSKTLPLPPSGSHRVLCVAVCIAANTSNLFLIEIQVYFV